MPEYFVIFGERKKIISIQRRDELLHVVKQKFDIAAKTNVAIQVFNTTYDDFVDIDSDSEELPIATKLNVVKLPETADINGTPVELDMSLSRTINPVHPEPSTSSAENQTNGQVITVMTNNDTMATLSTSYEGKTWPSKFVLPVCKFGDNLKTALSTKQSLTPALRTALMDTLYSEITAYTFYPTSTQYSEVIQALLTAYPYLRHFQIGDVVIEGDSCVRKWKNMLADKLRNMRKRRDQLMPQVQSRQLKRKTSTTPTVTATAVKSINQWGVVNFLPEREKQEDNTSIHKAKDWMKAESIKRKQDLTGINLRMKLTFADRRKDIVDNLMTIIDLKKDYPCLFMEDEILHEFHRLTEIKLDQTFLAGIDKYGKPLMDKAPTELDWKKHILQLQSASKTESDRRRLTRYGCLLVLPTLMKERLDHIICPENSKPEHVTTPLLVFRGDIAGGEAEYRLIIDDEEIAEPLELIQAMECLMASYYIFNIAYPSGSVNSLTFIQKCIIGLADNAMTPRKVVSLLLKLSK